MQFDRDCYVSPLIERYARDYIKRLFSANRKFQTWRRLWVANARGLQDQNVLVAGQPITDEQIAEMETHLPDIDYEMATKLENKTRHDVTTHIQVYGKACPSAAGIIHWGCTSCYVTDNTEAILLRDGLEYLEKELAKVIFRFARFAEIWKSLPTLAYTHFQPAQPTTVGKRTCLWNRDLLIDLHNLHRISREVPFLGAKGATGTQASFLKIFNGDYEKVERHDQFIACQFGFDDQLEIVTGQTYSRKTDVEILSLLASLAVTAHKIGLDLRLLQHEKEIEEPAEDEQDGSSAMAYKRNPMLTERMCSLSRRPISMLFEAIMTAMSQILERSLDDSAIKRMYIPESFLAIDGILNILQHISEGLIVYPMMIRRNLDAELPFMATEDILMAMTASGIDRQVCHGWIRNHSKAAGKAIKEQGLENDLLKRLRDDSRFQPIHDSLDTILEPSQFIGCSVRQVDRFLAEKVRPALNQYLYKHKRTVVLHV